MIKLKWIVNPKNFSNTTFDNTRVHHRQLNFYALVQFAGGPLPFYGIILHGILNAYIPRNGQGISYIYSSNSPNRPFSAKFHYP